MTSTPGTPDVAARLRRGVLGLAAAACIGILVELATTRHWDSATQIIPWVAVVLALAAIAVVATGRHRRHLLPVRGTLGLVVASSLFGVWEHVESNHDAGSLDFRYATTWSTFSAPRQWWMAMSGGVGPSPPLVPLMLALVSAMVLLATAGDGERPDSRV